MSKEMTVHGYANNGPKGCRPRQPLVHIMYDEGPRELQSMSFHPDDAPAVVIAIIRAAKAARAGRKIKETKLILKDDQS